MDLATKALAEFIDEKGFQLSAISAATNIPYSALWGSLDLLTKFPNSIEI